MTRQPQPRHALPQSIEICKHITTVDTIYRVVSNLLGTWVREDAPLMSAGLDSLGATELISTLSEEVGSSVDPAALFDHPTIESLGKLFDAE